MKEKYKWLLITLFIVIIIAIVLGFLLKNHYDKGQENNKVESMFKLIIRT